MKNRLKKKIFKTKMSTTNTTNSRRKKAIDAFISGEDSTKKTKNRSRPKP